MGWNHRVIADLLEVHYISVGRWGAAFRRRATVPLCQPKLGSKAGGSRRLSAAQERSVQKSITDKTPDQFKLTFALWTRRAVCELVEASFGSALPEPTCGEYLKRWGFTAQRLDRHNYEQTPKAVRWWMQEQYPDGVTRAKAQGAEIHWGGRNRRGNDFQPGRGGQGQTPVAKHSSKRFS